MNDWEKLNKTSLPEKEDFYSHLNVVFTHMNVSIIGEKIKETALPEKEDLYIYRKIEHITDAVCTHTERVCQEF